MLTPDAWLYETAFDQFSRQYLVKQLVEKSRDSRRLRILDVGGNRGKTREFFPADEVVVVDKEGSASDGIVIADALDLPFASGSFDVVVSFDVFEHISAIDRETFILESLRVASKYVILAAPFSTPHVLESEKELNNMFRQLSGGKDHRWLKEHMTNSLPDADELTAQLGALGYQYQQYHSNNLALWELMQGLIFIADSIKAPERITQANLFYNKHFLELGDSTAPSYRQIFSIQKSKSPTMRTVADTQHVDPEVLHRFMRIIVKTVQGLMFGKDGVSDLSAALAEKDRHLSVLEDELKSIYKSDSWRIAQLVRRIKHLLQR
jgi:hypothetical protein